jgi:hypothetical protein
MWLPGRITPPTPNKSYEFSVFPLLILSQAGIPDAAKDYVKDLAEEAAISPAKNRAACCLLWTIVVMHRYSGIESR